MTNLTSAQQAQQQNRTTDGKYTNKTTSEAEVSLASPLVPDSALRELVRDEVHLSDAEYEAIGVQVNTALNASRNYSPQNIRAIVSDASWEHLGFDAVGRHNLRNALAGLDPDSARSAQAYLDTLGHPSPRQQNPTITQTEPPQPTGGINDPVDAASDPRIAAGERFDTVTSHGTVFHRSRPGLITGAPQAIRIQTDTRLNPDEVQHLAQLTGYSLATTGKGEESSDPDQDTDYSFILYNDTTKGQRYQRLEKFEENLAQYLVHGTPQRKTNRSGPIGSRLIEGFGPNAPRIAVYYDDAQVDAT